MGLSSSTKANKDRTEQPVIGPRPILSPVGSPQFESPGEKVNKIQLIHDGVDDSPPPRFIGSVDESLGIDMDSLNSRSKHDRRERSRQTPTMGNRNNLPQSPRDIVVPTVFRWTGPASNVYLLGDFNNWDLNKKTLMEKTDGNEFIIIVNLPPGTSHYKFLVDGEWKHSLSQPVVTDNNGNLNNYVNVQEINSLSLNQQDESGAILPDSPEGEYTQTIPEFQQWAQSSSNSVFGSSSPKRHHKKSGGPIELPPHLQRALLNSAPNPEDPSQLPLPHHVMLNHLYSHANDPSAPVGDNIYGLSLRYKKKFVTLVFYTPDTVDTLQL